eukprot:1832208-Prymnesium_polylepis.1
MCHAPPHPCDGCATRHAILVTNVPRATPPLLLAPSLPTFVTRHLTIFTIRAVPPQPYARRATRTVTTRAVPPAQLQEGVDENAEPVEAVEPLDPRPPMEQLMEALAPKLQRIRDIFSEWCANATCPP